ncbi:MAG: hypothetical protein EPO68_07410 [Planctomycetota bacterium]|nr:MAG: hypothetical protein EPO68_07410 [Planctomycetota bacterium]
MQRSSIAAILSVLGLAAGCSTPSVTLFPRAAQVTPDGEFAAATSGGGSASSDSDALNIDDDETVFAPRADLDWSRWHLTVDRFGVSSEGTGTAEAQIEFDGVTIPQGDTVDTDLDVDLTSATFCFDFLPVPNAELGIGVGVVLADFSIDMTSQTLGQTASADEEVPLPVLAARAGVDFGRFSLGALARGFEVEIDDVEVSYLDLDAHARYDLFQATDSHLRGGLVLGWRVVAFDAEFEDGSSTIDADMDYSGPYAGIAFTF